MLKKSLPLVLISAIAIVLITTYQPMSLVQSITKSQPEQVQSTDTATCQRFNETGFQVCGRLLAYWYKYGGLQQFGYPVSEPFKEISEVDGEEHTVQYFERAVFELHPKNQPPYDLLLSQLGRQKYQQKYPSGTSGTEWTGDPQPDLNISKQLRTGINIKLIRAEQGAITGLYSGYCGLQMTWVLQIENTGNTPFDAELDTGNLRMADSTGKSYSPTRECGGSSVTPYSGSFAQPTRMMPGDILRGTIAFNASDIPLSASYFQIRVNFSGMPVEFRYMLP